MTEIEVTSRNGVIMLGVHLDGRVLVKPADEWKKIAAQILRAAPSEKRSEASRSNGKKGGRPSTKKGKQS